jgi:hypothetical protein
MRRIASAAVWGCVSVLLVAPLAAWAAMAPESSTPAAAPNLRDPQ